jgi:hypothetical protein
MLNYRSLLSRKPFSQLQTMIKLLEWLNRCVNLYSIFRYEINCSNGTVNGTKPIQSYGSAPSVWRNLDAHLESTCTFRIRLRITLLTINRKGKGGIRRSPLQSMSGNFN